MRRRSFTRVALLVCISSGAPVAFGAHADSDAPVAASSAPTAESVYAELLTGAAFSSDAERERAQSLIDAAARHDPRATRWKFAQAMLLRLRAERVAAREAFEALVELEPNNADYQSWYGTAIFESMNEIGFLSKLSWANAGRDAYLQAVKLDPDHAVSRFALVQYYINAPGIAGGSYAKAAEQANGLLAIPGGKGAYFGHMALASIAGANEEWAEMSRQYTLAETAPGHGADPVQAMTAHAYFLLEKAKDPAAALAVTERATKANTDSKNATLLYFHGLAKQSLQDYQGAIDAYTAVLAQSPDARNTRLRIAECHEKLNNPGLALTHYDEFLKRFPDDDKAGEARAQARKLRKQLGM